MTTNTPQYYKEVSLRLNGVLDSVGLTEDICWKRINMWIQFEEIQSYQKFKWHVFGSQAEATTTPGLHSDADYVICRSYRIVKELESWVPSIPNLLIVSDENTHPGYIKLQAVSTDQPRPVYHTHNVYFKLDRHARSVLCNDSDLSKLGFSEHHGPANRNDMGIYIADHVIAIRLHSWPEQSSQWMTRTRRHNWPSQEHIGVVLETGALLVPVGHKLSGEKHLEWRLSFSYGEKILVWLFNPTQYKCYTLLKMIKKCFIKPVVSDVLSSYHCKTCMFYLIENTPTSMWQPDNLLLCVDLCLRLLYIWIESAICPNYFIPDENMFECKVYGHIQCKLLGILSNLLRQEGRYLVGISCDNIGQRLMMTCQTPIMEFELQCEDVARVMLMSVLELLVSFVNTVQSFFYIDLMLDQSILDRAFSVRGPRQEVNAILMTFLYSILGSKLASSILSQESTDQHGLDMAQEYLLWGSSSDVTSGKLKLAAFYLDQDNLDMSEDVLNEVHENYNYKISELTDISDHTLQAILSENLSTTKLISQYTAFWVLYHPSEIRCTPKALIPEMFHSTKSNQGDPYENNLPTMVRVDPKYFLYFLQFICYHRQNKRSHKEAALNNMICTIRQKHLAFLDTALNLLAYCLMQEGKLMNAYNVLSKSMKLAKQDSAAKWQIAFFVNATFRSLRRS